tara:strand:+ start:299 stop:679 length:381 start_codon:yes stop_codon:yes gene_type:complete
VREKKSFLCPFLSSTFCLFSVCCFDITFFCPLWLFRNQRERRDVFIHTHTRTEEEERLLRELLQREREREKKKEHGEERGNKTLRFVSMQQKRKRKEDFCFTRDDVVERSFFFNLLVPGGTRFLSG